MHTRWVTWLAEQLDRIGADDLLLRLLRELPRCWLDDLPPWLRFRAGILQPPTARITTELPLPGPEVFAAASSPFALKVALRSLAIELDRRLANTKHDPDVYGARLLLGTTPVPAQTRPTTNCGHREFNSR